MRTWISSLCLAGLAGLVGLAGLAGLVGFALACSSPSRPDPDKIAPPPPPDAAPAPAPAKRVGSACAMDPANPRGDCPASTLCAPLPGGMCTAFCAESACPDGATCVESGRIGQLCAAPCERDADCRASEGYVCDPTWRACLLPGLSAPRAPVCEDVAARPRKTFGQVAQISTSAGPGTYHFEPVAGLTKNGALTAVYITNSTPDFTRPHLNTLGVSTVARGGAVTGDRELGSERQNHYDPWMAVDRRGALHLVWMGFDGGHAPERNMQIAMSTSADGLTWSPPVAVHDPKDCPDNAPGCFDKPMIAIGPDHARRRRDAIYVSYFSGPAGGLAMRRSIDGGKTFSPSVRVTDAGAYGDVEVDSAGVVHVVIASASPQRGPFGDPEGEVVYLRSADGGATWSAPVAVSAPDESIPFYFSNPQVVPDPARRRIYVVYPQGAPDGRWDIMLATSKDNGATWSRIRVHDDERCANHMTPTAALDPRTGAIHVLWTESVGGGHIAYARCDRGGAKCAPAEQVSEQPFAAYRFVRHAPAWLGEYYTLIVDTRRRALHAVWTQPVDEGGVARSRIFHATGRLR